MLIKFPFTHISNSPLCLAIYLCWRIKMVSTPHFKSWFFLTLFWEYTFCVLSHEGRGHAWDFIRKNHPFFYGYSLSFLESIPILESFGLWYMCSLWSLRSFGKYLCVGKYMMWIWYYCDWYLLSSNNHLR